MSLADHSNFYEVLDALDTVGVISRVKARIRTSGAPVLIYRLPEEGSSKHEVKILNDLKRWGTVRNPRLPMMIDAWQADGRIEYAQIEYSGTSLNDPAGHGPLMNSRRGLEMEVVWQSLNAIRALHDASVSHEHLRRDSFEILRDGTVYLRDNGLLHCLNSQLAKGGSQSDIGFMLSSNLMRHDVGDWALTITECLSGQSLANLDDLETPLLPPHIYEGAVTQLRRTFKEPDLANFMERALACRGKEEPEFGNAIDARKAFEKEFPKVVRP
ncbi:hypothetical protein KQI84_05450 [bacterium]|nr:hypothetical protein [bacterium]